MEDRLEKNFYILCREKFREHIQKNLLYKCNREIYLVITFLNILYIEQQKAPAEPFLENNAPSRGVNLDRAQSRVRFIGGCTQLDRYIINIFIMYACRAKRTGTRKQNIHLQCNAECGRRVGGRLGRLLSYRCNSKSNYNVSIM